MRKHLISIIALIVLFTCFSSLKCDTGINRFVNQDLFYKDYNPEMDYYDVKFYHIDIEVSNLSTYIKGSAIILVEIIHTSPLTQLVLDAGNYLYIDSVTVNKENSEFIHSGQKLTIKLKKNYNQGEMASIIVHYNARGNTEERVAGIYNAQSTAWGEPVTWTLSEPLASRNWFPCKQVLTDKADSVYVYITTEAHLKAGSNGLLKAERKIADNKIRYEWKSIYPVAYYLISFAVGEYRDYSFYAPINNSNDSILIQNFIYDDNAFLTQNKSRIDATSEMMQLFTELFGQYPFKDEKYGHCIVPSGGGMEHQTMTTLENFSFTLVSHELAHQWFGNYVTCATWQDIWINEGFASYAEYIAYQYLESQAQADRWMNDAHNYSKFQSGGSIYVPLEEARSVERIFDYRLSYKKAAAIIHMIRYIINDDSLFFKTLRNFITVYGNDNATGENFRELLNINTGIDFTDFFDQWYYGEGHPVFNIRWEHQNDTLQIQSLQTGSSSTSLFNIPLTFKIEGEKIDTTIIVSHDNPYHEWKIFIPGKVTNINADPEHYILAEININGKNSETNFDPRPTISDPSFTSFSIQLNPSLSGIYNTFIISEDGEIAYSGEANSDSTEISISEHPAGNYTLLLTHNHNLYIYPFVKE